MLPTSTHLKIDVHSTIPAAAEAVVALVFEEEKSPRWKQLDAERTDALHRLLASGVVRGAAREVGVDVLPASGGKFRRVYAVGVGKREKLTTEALRQSAGAALGALRQGKVGRAALLLPADPGPLTPADAAEALTTGSLLAAFEFTLFKGTAGKKDLAEAKRPAALSIIGDGKAVRGAVARGTIIADAQNFARTIASRPANDINPPKLAGVVQAMAREAKLSCRVMDEKQLTRLGMGGILAVGSGAMATPPRMIVLEHKPTGRRPGKPLLLVGKTITFDTGGISIKPADKMGKMIYDKCGGMAVMGTMLAAAKLRLPLHIVGILSAAENAISQKAYRPGDILRLYNGVTVEVTNTDAEGRLVLSDALAWGIEQFKPAAVVDLATLTGGVITALGKTMAGIMSNNDRLVTELTEAGISAGEKMWRLPLGEEQREQIKSDHADIVNSAGREGHPLQGGAFLSYFVPEDGSVPWAHLDIAGVADIEKDLPYYEKGATGWGVRTLLEWMRRRI